MYTKSTNHKQLSMGSQDSPPSGHPRTTGCLITDVFFSVTLKNLQFSSNLGILWLILKLRLVQTSLFAKICKKVHETYEN